VPLLTTKLFAATAEEDKNDFTGSGGGAGDVALLFNINSCCNASLGVNLLDGSQFKHFSIKSINTIS
jgi:hypothetical protein